MKFFIDTANLEQIREASEFGVLDGVTTNPSLMAKEGISGKENVIAHYKAICEIVDGDVSAEVIAHGRDKKVTIIKMRRRKHYRRQAGHRQWFTQVKITDISGG